MSNYTIFQMVRIFLVSIWLMFLLPPAAQSEQVNLVERGKYLTTAGGCISCHTDTKKKGEPFAGGAPIKTPFGTFVAPNITPSNEHGIGRWSDADFIQAMRKGKNPAGEHYFPVFPYTSYTQMTISDLKAMKAYLFSLTPVEAAAADHSIPFPFRLRFLQSVWKMFFFREGAYTADPKKTEETNRGAYLANALAHCGECHTPRNIFGGLDYDRWMAGTANGPEGGAIPNITPHTDTGLAWSEAEIVDYLKTGATPDFDFAGSLMADVIADNTSKMSDADLRAIATYLRQLPPIKNAF